MCLNIQSFVVSEAWSFENFSIKENNFFWWHLVREFDGGVECISEINEVAEFFFGLRSTLKKMSSINLFQMIGFCGLAASSRFSMWAIRQFINQASVSQISIVLLLTTVKWKRNKQTIRVIRGHDAKNLRLSLLLHALKEFTVKVVMTLYSLIWRHLAQTPSWAHYRGSHYLFQPSENSINWFKTRPKQ